MDKWGDKTPPSAPTDRNNQHEQKEQENVDVTSAKTETATTAEDAGAKAENANTVEEIVEEVVEDKDGKMDTADGQDVSLEEKVLTLQAELEQTKKQSQEYYAHLQRLQAEFDNYRKRTNREKEEFARYASEGVVASLLPILDNFERAIAAAQNTKDLASFAQGVEMIYKQMLNTLAKEGLQPIEAMGQPFDPNIHEAVMQVDSEEYPENTVVEELRKGYYLKDKLLRPSMVKVSC